MMMICDIYWRKGVPSSRDFKKCGALLTLPRKVSIVAASGCTSSQQGAPPPVIVSPVLITHTIMVCCVTDAMLYRKIFSVGDAGQPMIATSS